MKTNGVRCMLRVSVLFLHNSYPKFQSLEHAGQSGKCKWRGRALPDDMPIPILFTAELTHDLFSTSLAEQKLIPDVTTKDGAQHLISSPDMGRDQILLASSEIKIRTTETQRDHNGCIQHGAAKPQK